MFNTILFIFSSFTDDAVQAGLIDLKANRNQNRNEQNRNDRLYKDTLYDVNLNSKASPVDYSSFASNLFFSWYSNVLWFGRNGNLTTDNLWNLEDKLKIDNILSEFNKEFYKELDQLKNENKNKRKANFSSLHLMKVFIRCYGFYFIKGTFLKILHDLFQFLNPKLLEILILYIKDSENQVSYGNLINHQFITFNFLFFDHS